ncbi:bifunctional 2-polyprenyl-6-hydroxyphenol methylase/3-demethylubiquinol 3-O-methyltransferase UbiG [Microbispora sp. H11081]|uniref:class I SAM-dependent methyltransferase n=1 Tax=Microbispora sp. H11081 TaxID=2729107 RepID=UPI001475790A|nr:class I SAM-dependent methyltransferase [Microbispora sp. H11081]
MTGATEEEQREYVRRLAAAHVEKGDPLGWFEPLYSAAERGEALVPWAHRVANPHLVEWAGGRSGEGRTALVVGCGMGDDAEHLAGLGWAVTAFDVSPSAVRAARSRFPESSVDYVAADLLAPPQEWRQAFDLVVEIYTVQVLRGEHRERAVRTAGSLVAPGGTLLVVARAREEDEPVGRMPWPLTRAEVDAFASGGLRPVRVRDVYDDATPPLRRWVAEFIRP